MTYQAPTTPLEAVTLAIKLAITAPSEEKANECAEIGAMIAVTMKLSEQEVDTAKALALAEIAIEEACRSCANSPGSMAPVSPNYGGGGGE